MKTLALTACLVSIIGLAAPASAGPYELIAIYTKQKDNNSQVDVEIKVKNGMTLPDRANRMRLDRVVIRFERSGLGAVTTGTFRNFAVAVQRDGAKTSSLSVPSKDIDPSTTRDLILWDSVEPLKRSTRFTATIRGKFSADFLCSQELMLRNAGPRRTVACPPAPPTKPIEPKAKTGKLRKEYELKLAAFEAKNAPYQNARAKYGVCGSEAMYKLSTLQPERPLFADGREVLFTFCRGTEGDPVNWEAARGEHAGATADELKQTHKASLHDLMLTEKVLGRFMNHYAEPLSGADAPDQPTNLFVEESFDFRVRMVGSLFVLEQQDESDVKSLNNTIHQTSRIVIRASDEIGACPYLDDYKYVFKTSGEDDATVTDVLPIAYRSGCEVELNVDMKKYLGKEVTLQILEKSSPEIELAVVEQRFSVANLGFQWTAPVISEVLAAVQAKSPADLTASSSIPLGIAIGRHDEQRLALSFAFRVSYNTRRVPDFSRYFSLFGHFTVLADSDADDDTDDEGFATAFAVGAGISAFQFFHFGWAIETGGEHRNYLLLSIDIKDISKFALGGLE